MNSLTLKNYDLKSKTHALHDPLQKLMVVHIFPLRPFPILGNLREPEMSLDQ